nr:hybrid signal transduction histidine kinase M [Tanacetum cinerariifolium]
VDKIVLSWLLFTLSDSLRARLVVACPKTAKEAWALISDIVKDNKRSHANALKAELRFIKLEAQSMESYFQKIDSIDTFPDLKTVRSLLIVEEMRLKSKALSLPVDSSSPMVLVTEARTNSRSSTSQGKPWKPCFNFAKGSCRYGDSCRYVHDANARGNLGMHNGSNAIVPNNVTINPNVTVPNNAAPMAFHVSPAQCPPPGFAPQVQPTYYFSSTGSVTNTSAHNTNTPFGTPVRPVTNMGLSHSLAVPSVPQATQPTGPSILRSVQAPQSGITSTEPGYIQNYNFYPHDSPSFPQQYLCYDNCGGPHETFQCQPMNQNFYNSNSSGFDQSQPPQSPVIHPPPQETSIKILRDQENAINSVQTFLRKFNRISFFETPKVLLLAWDRVFKIKDALENKQYKPEDIQELLRKLFNDVQNIHEELAEYINTPG